MEYNYKFSMKSIILLALFATANCTSNLSILKQKSADGWDDSYVSEQINAKDQVSLGQQIQQLNQNSAQTIEENFAKTVLNNKIKQMQDEMVQFSKSLDKEHYTSALMMKKDLEESDHLNNLELQVNTKDLYEQAFVFPNVAQYDHVQQQLTEV